MNDNRGIYRGWGIHLWLFGFLLSSCSSCYEDGCDAFERPAQASSSQGIAGVAAYRSDESDNGCQECGFSAASLDIWEAGERIDDAEAAAALAKEAPSSTIEIRERYVHALEVGNYLACAGSVERTCAAFEVAESGVTTINLRTAKGPTRVVIFDAGSATARTERIFEGL